MWAILPATLKGLGPGWRCGGRGVGSSVVGHVVVSLGHAHWSMTHSHSRATSSKW
jgi:hypothetical protein